MVSEGTKKFDRRRLNEAKYRQQVIERLIQDYKDEIYFYCLNMLGSVYGEDIAQEVFVTAWEKLETYRQDAQIGGWLKGIAKNKCMQFLRNRYRHADLMKCWLQDIRRNVHDDQQLSVEDEQINHAERQELREEFDKLTECISQLPEQDRIFIRLRYYKNIPVAEIGELFGTKDATVYKRLKRALQKLKKCMENDR